ncbi:hypothetical protein DFH08DRAFT_811124 [Mycena albidolilacea]|uniref:Uncharacterized protein n=1 Tax=Mycena albidolilacea TaxID=1033008 RepID=A0AAD6ZW56_9AGAR|nr:hypothetical protein DFH08DRAFT_811124 [Mycena albidolilacea]
MSFPALDSYWIPFNRDLGEFLYMLEITQSLYYFQNFKQDDWKHKPRFSGPSLLLVLVTLVLLVYTLSIVGDYIAMYLAISNTSTTGTGYGNFTSILYGLSATAQPTPVYGFTTGILAILVQAFLVFGYWRFVFTCNLMLTLYTSLVDRPKFKIPVGLWLVTEVVMNAGITSVLLWEFRKVGGIVKETQSVLDWLTAVTIQSGAAAATIAGAALIAYFINPETNGPRPILPLIRLYGEEGLVTRDADSGWRLINLRRKRVSVGRGNGPRTGSHR